MKLYQAVAATVCALSAIPAQAAVFNFDFVTTSAFFGPDQNGSGAFTTSDVASQVEGHTAYAITGITGQINNVAISGLTDFSKSLIPTYYYFTDGPSFLSGTGVHFNAGDYSDIRFFSPSTSPVGYRISGNGTILASVNATSSAVAAVPEPATWAMMIAGFGMIGFAARRRPSDKRTVAYA